jgi:MerR family regulatory protein
LKVGNLAKKTGLSIRALHHYDSIGLPSPSLSTDSGARFYGQQDLVRDALANEPDLVIGVGVDEKLLSYVQKAMARQ